MIQNISLYCVHHRMTSISIPVHELILFFDTHFTYLHDIDEHPNTASDEHDVWVHFKCVRVKQTPDRLVEQESHNAVDYHN